MAALNLQDFCINVSQRYSHPIILPVKGFQWIIWKMYDSVIYFDIIISTLQNIVVIEVKISSLKEPTDTISQNWCGLDTRQDLRMI